MILSAALLGMVVTGVLSAGSFVPSSMMSTSAQAAAAEQRQIFIIENMTCALCPLTVKKAMEGVSGVKSVVIDFGAKTATVTFDATATTIEAIAAASTNAGYPAAAKS
jgi:mercuric ion binding protein